LIWKTISLIIGVSSWVPAIAGIYLFNKINRRYKPLIYLLIFYAIVETSGQILIWLKKGEFNSILMNIFVLIDYIFIHILLNFWKGKKNKLIDIFIIAILIIIWIIDNLIINKINTTNSTFRIIYSIILVIKIIDVINKQISKLNFQITSDPIFIVCLFLLIQFTFKSIYETSFIFSRLVSDRIYLYSFIIHLIIDFSGYAIFTKAILCMKKSIRLTSSY
jgi:hypothetical protein